MLGAKSRARVWRRLASPERNTTYTIKIKKQERKKGKKKKKK
jgi:hypothetical protein